MNAPLVDHTRSNQPIQPLATRAWLAAALALAAVLFLAGLSGFGIWDPWELSAADAARRVLEDSAEERARPPLSPWLIAGSFDLFSVREWAGRLPIALSGLLGVALLWAWVRRFAAERVALYSLVVACTSVALIFNSRQMLGAAPSLAAGAMVALGAMGVLFASPERAGLPWPSLALCAAGVGVGVLAGGALLSVLPPLLACVAAAALLGRLNPAGPRLQSALGWAVAIASGLLAFRVGWDIALDAADYSPWIGGRPLGEQPPTFDRTLEIIFHGFAPWSALLPVAVGGALRLGDDETGALRADAPLRVVALLWAALAYAAHSLFQSRFGTASYPGVLALAVLVALWLRDLEASRRGYWAAALVSAFFTGLVIRDFALYPASPIDALAVTGAEVPEVFNPKRAWAAVMGAFGAAAFVATSTGPTQEPRLRPAAPYRWLWAQWREGGWGLRAWFVLAALSLLCLLVFGALAMSIPRQLHITSLIARAGKVMFAVPLALPIAVLGVQVAWYVAQRYARFRLVPLWAAAVAVAAYTSFGFLPSLSGHFSPREVFDIYNKHASESEPLAEYQVGSRAAAYYATGSVEELENRTELLRHLWSDEERHWATFPADQLSEIDRDFRRRSHRHLFVASDPHARVVLVANRAVEDLKDRNPLADAVLDEPPAIENDVHVNFEDKIEFLGYNLELPGGDYVGPGQKFQIEWVFRALSSNIGNYQVFVHIDGAGNRIHGDHDPVDDLYPARLWLKGDVVIDRQTLSVPTNYRPGTYTIMVGFYRGDTRLKVTEGPQDGENRAKVGVLTVR